MHSCQEQNLESVDGSMEVDSDDQERRLSRPPGQEIPDDNSLVGANFPRP